MNIDEAARAKPEILKNVRRPHESSTDDAAPWVMIEPGRYQPKRTRGSCVGRELG